jgi:PAS domain S-box-containing protein
MLAAYALGNQFASSAAVSADSLLLQSVQSLESRTTEIFRRQRSEAQRIAFTSGVAQAIRTNNPEAMLDAMKGLARLSDMDSLLLVNLSGQEVLGLLHVPAADDFSVSTGTNLANLPVVDLLLSSGQFSATGLAQTPQGMMIYVGVPVVDTDGQVGLALAGYALRALLVDLRASNGTDLVLYATDGQILQTTLQLETNLLEQLTISPELLQQTLSATVPVGAGLIFDQQPYRAAYVPFAYGEALAGVIAVITPDFLPLTAQAGQQAAALFAAIFAAVVVIGGFFAISRAIWKIEQVSATADALARGDLTARTGLTASDEVGVLGLNLDRFALNASQKQDAIQGHLRRERRERMYLVSVLESIPDGVIVQDMEGKLLLMNNRARALLGTQKDLHRYLSTLQHAAKDQPGEKLLPGIYAIGDPQRVLEDGRMLSAQAAAVISPKGSQIGTVLIIRDITAEVQQVQAREQLLAQLSEDIQQPLAGLAQNGAQDSSKIVNGFAHEIGRHAAALQKMIVEMRELTAYNRIHAEQVQRPLAAETLIIAVANDWRQIVQAAHLELRVQMHTRGVMLLGDESRLRWAIGNILDNAIKYTLPGGSLTLEINDVEDGMLNLRVRDNGVGIAEEDLPGIFMPFYRGTPIGPDGEVIRVPGMGQGLPLARQVIQAHGGTLRIRSRAGVGTAVYIALPVTSGSSYMLPLLPDQEMEGETIRLPEDADRNGRL